MFPAMDRMVAVSEDDARLMRRDYGVTRVDVVVCCFTCARRHALLNDVQRGSAHQKPAIGLGARRAAPRVMLRICRADLFWHAWDSSSL